MVQDGYFSLSADKKLDVSAGRTLPFTLGHEIARAICDAADRRRCRWGEAQSRARRRRRGGLYPSDPEARKAVMAATGGGALAICDFVGSDKSL
jgi:hypothetical protein